MSRPFALIAAPCVLGPTALKESQLEMEGGRKRRVVEARLIVGISLNDPEILTSMEKLAPLLRQEMSLAMREGDDGGAFEFKAKKKIAAMTILLGPRPTPPRELKPVFRFTVAECLTPPIFKGARDGSGSVKFVWKVRITSDDLAEFPKWLGCDMAITVEQTQVTLAELEARKKDGEDVSHLIEPNNEAGKKKGKGKGKKEPEQLTIADAATKNANAEGLAAVNAAIDSTDPALLANRADADDEDDADVLSDILGLVADEIAEGLHAVGVPVDVVKTWTKKDRELARKWASAIHLKASDNAGVRVPARPAVIDAFAREFTAAGGVAVVAPEPDNIMTGLPPPSDPSVIPVHPGPSLSLVRSDSFDDPDAKGDGFDGDDDDSAELASHLKGEPAASADDVPDFNEDGDDDNAA